MPPSLAPVASSCVVRSLFFFAHFVFVCYAVSRGLYSNSVSSATSSLPLPSLSGLMSRWLFPWSGSIKKRACRYLLQHYLGHFLQERLSLDQLGLDVYNGSGVIRNINLDVWVSFDRKETISVHLKAQQSDCFRRAHAPLIVSQLYSSSTTIPSVALTA